MDDPPVRTPARTGVLNQGAYPLLHPPPRADPGLSTQPQSAPASGPFSLTVRIYWPADAVLDGTYTLPPVTRLEDH